MNNNRFGHLQVIQFSIQFQVSLVEIAEQRKVLHNGS